MRKLTKKQHLTAPCENIRRTLQIQDTVKWYVFFDGLNWYWYRNDQWEEVPASSDRLRKLLAFLIEQLGLSLEEAVRAYRMLDRDGRLYVAPLLSTGLFSEGAEAPWLPRIPKYRRIGIEMDRVWAARYRTYPAQIDELLETFSDLHLWGVGFSAPILNEMAAELREDLRKSAVRIARARRALRALEVDHPDKAEVDVLDLRNFKLPKGYEEVKKYPPGVLIAAAFLEGLPVRGEEDSQSARVKLRLSPKGMQVFLARMKTVPDQPGAPEPSCSADQAA